jgi:hypothetical protein
VAGTGESHFMIEKNFDIGFIADLVLREEKIQQNYRIGDSLESAIEDVLTKSGINFRKTKRAERIEGFDLSPDFIIPREFNPRIIIEAKITEDDGTARDKVTRIQHLGELSLAGRSIDIIPRMR